MLTLDNTDVGIIQQNELTEAAGTRNTMMYGQFHLDGLVQERRNSSA